MAPSPPRPRSGEIAGGVNPKDASASGPPQYLLGSEPIASPIWIIFWRILPPPDHTMIAGGWRRGDAGRQIGP